MADSLDVCLFCGKNAKDERNSPIICLGKRMVHDTAILGPGGPVEKLVQVLPETVVSCRQFPSDAPIPDLARDAAPALVTHVEQLLAGRSALVRGIGLAMERSSPKD